MSKEDVEEAPRQAAHESFANLCAAYLEAENEDKRCDEKLQTIRDEAQRAIDRAATTRKQLEDTKWLNGKTIRTAVIGAQVVTLRADGGAVQISVTDAECKDEDRQ